MFPLCLVPSGSLQSCWRVYRSNWGICFHCFLYLYLFFNWMNMIDLCVCEHVWVFYIASEWCVFFSSGAVILLGRTNMFRFNHPKEAAKLREKRKVRLNQCLGNLNLFTIFLLMYTYLDCCIHTLIVVEYLFLLASHPLVNISSETK